jgi:hypothetical protein
MVSHYNLVSPMQFGARAGSSTVDAGLTFCNDVERARHKKWVTTSLTFDIPGFFDNINHNRLLIVYTDGSQIETDRGKQSGAGVVAYLGGPNHLRGKLPTRGHGRSIRRRSGCTSTRSTICNTIRPRKSYTPYQILRGQQCRN